MDDTTSSTPQPGQTANLANELAHVTQEMYKRNLELAEKNKTLSLLRQIDEIVLGSATDIQDFAQKVVNTIMAEGDIKDAVIYLMNKPNSSLDRLAISQTEGLLRAEAEFNKKYYNENISLANTDNLIVIAVNEKKVKQSTRLYDILLESFSEPEAQKIQEILGVTTVHIYPLIVRNEILGVMVVGVSKKDEILLEYQHDLLNRLTATVGIAIDNALLYKHIQEANEQLKQLDKLKDEFVSLASHELRTPMTAIKSYMWMLIEHNMVQDPKGNEYLSHAYEATDRLINLVNDMLNVSRIESGRMIINLEPVDLTKLITDVVAEVKPAADKQQIHLVVQMDPHGIHRVQADMNKIKEVLINLIGNSIKFTPPEGTITIQAVPENNKVKISVQDNGRGIDAQDISKLFTKFGMIEKNYAANQLNQGTGLGLYICKSIIELHGGTISVASPGINQGSTFMFTLPKAI